MPSAIVLQPYDSSWPAAAEAAGKRLLAASQALVAVHHIGSTSIVGMLAKPVIDLLGVAKDLPALDEERQIFEAFGYEWRGEYGLPGRRYCTLSDGEGRRLVHLHCYSDGDPSINRHLAFRDRLRASPQAAAAYRQEKLRCARLHPTDGGAYTECKSAWIERVEQEALHKP
jgi:GrpB-like predicted nucleotidyltransferase (UPF0157 family)